MSEIFQPPPLTIGHVCGAKFQISPIQALNSVRCPRCNQIIKIPLEFLIADRQYFHAFGDESSFKEAVVYGIVVIHDIHLQAFQRFLVNLKLAYGVPSWGNLHCREIFNGDAKKKTSWKRLSESQVFKFSEEVLAGLVLNGAGFFVGAVDKNEYPSEFPESEIFPKAITGIKQLTALVFQAAMMPLAELDQKGQLGLHVDADKTSISYFGKTMRAEQNYKFTNPLTGTVSHPKISIPKQKPLLLEVADLFAYVSAHALSSQDSRNKDRFRFLYKLCKPIITTLTYDPEARMRGEIPNSRLQINHDLIFAS